MYEIKVEVKDSKEGTSSISRFAVSVDVTCTGATNYTEYVVGRYLTDLIKKAGETTKEILYEYAQTNKIELSRDYHDLKLEFAELARNEEDENVRDKNQAPRND